MKHAYLCSSLTRAGVRILAGVVVFVIASAACFGAPGGDVFSVTKFGAVCDGVTDDTAAVQRAIDAAQGAGGGVVEFPTGTCFLNTTHPSTHPWFFYNLKIGSNVKLRGKPGAKLLQGPGGRHVIVAGATEDRNTVLAFGADYTVIRFQNTNFNGGFLGLKATSAGSSSVTLANA